MANLCRVLALFSILITAGCQRPAKTPPAADQWQAKPVLETQMQESVKYFRLADPTIREFFENCYGLAAFYIYKAPQPDAGAFGRGKVFEKGNLVGTATVSQKTVDISVPGEYFREIIFFEDKADFDNFKAHEVTFGPQVVGIALSDGVAIKSDYTDGLAVFILADDGPVTGGSLAGQKFVYAPIPQ
jgi:hypothetical protein